MCICFLRKIIFVFTGHVHIAAEVIAIGEILAEIANQATYAEAVWRQPAEAQNSQRLKGLDNTGRGLEAIWMSEDWMGALIWIGTAEIQLQLQLNVPERFASAIAMYW